jgi:hypothetical protein
MGDRSKGATFRGCRIEDEERRSTASRIENYMSIEIPLGKEKKTKPAHRPFEYLEEHFRLITSVLHACQSHGISYCLASESRGSSAYIDEVLVLTY